jgi:predicted phosphodiesterase
LPYLGSFAFQQKEAMMRIGLISDIHGNLVALEAVLQELSQEQVDQIICLGDVAALGPQPRHVIERLHHLRCPVILGNTDAWLLTPPVATSSSSENTRTMYDITQWCAEQLDASDQAYLQTFPPIWEDALDEERTLLCFHGSPRSFDDVLAATTPDAEVKQMLAGSSATVMVGGHTHIQMIRRYEESFFVNAGSVGLPGVNAGSPALPVNRRVRWAEYGVLSIEHGRLSIDLRRTPLDLLALLEAGRNSGMPHFEWWAQKWDRG